MNDSGLKKQDNEAGLPSCGRTSTQTNAKVIHNNNQIINNQSQYGIEWEPYVEHGVAKLRPKKQLTKDSFSPAAQEMAAVIYGLNDTNTPELKARGI